MTTIFLIGVLGAVISAIVGTFWYSNPTPMGKWHMQYLGFDKLSEEEKMKMIAEAKPTMWKSYSAQLALSFLTSLFIGFVTFYSVQNGAPANAVYFYVVTIWAGFTVPAIGQSIIWGKVPSELVWKKFFSDSISNLVAFLIIAFIATLLV